MAPVIPCPVLVGRSREVQVLEAALAAACAGSGSVVFITGEAGIGKSRLVQELCRRAEEQRRPILRGRAVPGSSTAAFRPFTEAFSTVGPRALADPRLGPWREALVGVVSIPGSPEGAAELSDAARGEGIIRLLTASCPEGGVLVVEDLHWADPETVAVVEHLSDNLDRAPVVALVTVRTGEGSGAEEMVRRVSARRSCVVLDLEALNDAQVAAMAHSCVGGLDGEGVRRLVELSDGVPFFVEEMLTTARLPPSLASAVAERLASLGEDARAVLVTAAAFGRHFDWRLLPDATGLSSAAVLDALDRGVEAQLLAAAGSELRFRHALTAEAVLESMTPPRQVATAAAALAALDRAHLDLPPALGEVAARLAERAEQPSRAGRLHLAAGEHALAAGALRTATAAFRRASELLDGAERVRAAELLVHSLVQAGRVDDALSRGRDLAASLPPERAAILHLRLAGAATAAARHQTAQDHLSAAVPLVELVATASLEAELALRDAELAMDVDPERARSRATEALETARERQIPDIECAALQLLGRTARRTSPSEAEVWFRRSLATAERSGLAVWRLRALHELGTIELLDTSAVHSLLEARALAESLGAMATLATLDVEISAGYAGLFDPEAQAWHGREAAERGRELGLAMIEAHGWFHVAAAASLVGDDATVAEAGDRARAAAPPGNRDMDGLLVAVNDVVPAMLRDDLGTAMTAAERSTELLRGSLTVPPASPRALGPLLLAVHHRPEAPGAVAELEAAGLRTAGAGRGLLDMARAVITGWTDPRSAEGLALQADATLAPDPLMRHLARRCALEAARADGWAVPDRWMPEAARWLREHGFTVLADVCDGLSRSPGIPPAWVELGVTRREADVLRLVIEGLSNRDVAAQLHLSVRTVEKHVESLLRKTASSSRTQLARVATT